MSDRVRGQPLRDIIVDIQDPTFIDAGGLSVLDQVTKLAESGAST